MIRGIAVVLDRIVAVFAGLSLQIAALALVAIATFVLGGCDLAREVADEFGVDTGLIDDIEDVVGTGGENGDGSGAGSGGGAGSEGIDDGADEGELELCDGVTQVTPEGVLGGIFRIWFGDAPPLQPQQMAGEEDPLQLLLPIILNNWEEVPMMPDLMHPGSLAGRIPEAPIMVSGRICFKTGAETGGNALIRGDRGVNQTFQFTGASTASRPVDERMHWAFRDTAGTCAISLPMKDMPLDGRPWQTCVPYTIIVGADPSGAAQNRVIVRRGVLNEHAQHVAHRPVPGLQASDMVRITSPTNESVTVRWAEGVRVFVAVRPNSLRE